ATHPLLGALGCRMAAGRLGRRAFLRLAALLGATGGVLGAASPSLARAEPGGRLVLGGRVHPLDDPHALAWMAPANVVHQVCETLTRTGHDGITRPHLLSHWQV